MLTKFVTEFRHHQLCQASHEELLRKLWFDAEGLESGFPRCLVLKNGQVESSAEHQ